MGDVVYLKDKYNRKDFPVNTSETYMLVNPSVVSDIYDSGNDNVRKHRIFITKRERLIHDLTTLSTLMLERHAVTFNPFVLTDVIMGLKDAKMFKPDAKTPIRISYRTDMSDPMLIRLGSDVAILFCVYIPHRGIPPVW